MEVRLFGAVAVRHGNDLVPITGRRPALVLRALALEPRRSVATDLLVDAAWPDHPPDNPPKALQTLIVRLRRIAGRSLVATTPSGYALGPEVTTDVERVSRLLTRAREEADDGRRLHALTPLLDEWSGSPFADLDCWRAADASSARLAEQRTTLEDEWLTLRVRREGPSTTLGDLEAAVAREPLRESRWLLLAEALRDADRVADALGALQRARRHLAAELGMPPSSVLQAFEEDLVLMSAPTPVESRALRVERHRENARAALADDDAALAGKELTRAIEESRAAGHPTASIVDLHLELSAAQRRSGGPNEARRALEDAADLARMSGDTARLAAIALAGSGDAWQTTLDSTSSAIPLLQEALTALPAGPTALRARLLARYAVASSHVEPQTTLEVVLADAAEIAAIVDDPTTTATVLIARNIVDQDPRRRKERHQRFARLLDLSEDRQEPQWRSAVLPSLARLTAQEGDIVGALALLDDVIAYGEAASDPVARAATGSRAVLEATVADDFSDVIAAIDTTARCNESAMTDPSASAVMRWAQTGVATLVYDRLESVPERVMPFPRTTMDVLMTAYVAAALGSTGRTAQGLDVLRRIDPALVAELPRDLYWLSVLWALGRAVQELGARDHAAALHECCLPVADLFVVDGGFFFLGAVNHHAGIGAAIADRAADARRLLAAAASQHERAGSPFWTRQSRDALAWVATLRGR